MANEAKEEARLLHKTELTSTGATAALGLTVISRLVEFGVATVFIDGEGFIKVADPGEVTLDALPEEMALKELLGRGYDDPRLVEYLKDREARMGRG